MNKIKLGKIAYYSDTRIDLSNLTEKNYVGTDNLLQNKKGKVDSEYLRKKGKVTEYKENDILIANIRPYLRKIWRAKGKGGSSADVLTIRVGDSEFYPNFIYYNLFQDTFFDWVMKGAKGSKMPRGDKNQIMEFQIPKFDYLTQKKIVSVLSVIDDKIELNHKINTELEQLARQIYEYWFLQFDFPDENSNPYKSSGGSMTYNNILKRDIPSKWKVKTINEVCDIQYGYPFDTKFFNKVEKGLPVVRIRDIKANTISTFSTENNIEKKYIIKEKDLLIGMDGNFHINHWSRSGSYLNQRLTRIRKKLLSTLMIQYQIKPYILKKENIGSGSTVAHLSDKDIKQLHIIMPNEELLEVFNNSFDTILEKQIYLQKESTKLESQRDFLLPMLMNGQINVDDIQIE